MRKITMSRPIPPAAALPSSARQSRFLRARSTILAAVLFALPIALPAAAETCTTQSGMAPAERDGLAAAALRFAALVQANDATALRAATIAELQKDFGGLQYLVTITAPKLTGETPAVDQVYVLDATSLKPTADGTAPDAQFFCSLNRSTMEADFLIPALPPGRYAFAIANLQPSASNTTTVPWRLAFLLRQEQGKWLLAGFYPKPLTVAGHDGLWYWNQARSFAKQKQPWNAYLDYHAAESLLRPADFVLSTHLEKLRTEAAGAAPPALSDGVTTAAPLAIRSASGAEYRFTSLGVDESTNQSGLDVVLHLRVDPAAPADPAAKPAPQTDPIAAGRQHNLDAMAALLAAYPELRKPFHGVRIIADTPNQPPLVTEAAMAEIR